MEKGKFLNQYITLIKYNIKRYNLKSDIDYKLKIIDDRYIIYVACQPIKFNLEDGVLYKQCKGLYKVLDHCVCKIEQYYHKYLKIWGEDYFKIFIIDTNYISRGIGQNYKLLDDICGLNYDIERLTCWPRKSDITCWLRKNNNNDEINFMFIHDGVNAFAPYDFLSNFHNKNNEIKKLDELEIKDLFLYLYNHQNEIREFYFNGISQI